MPSHRLTVLLATTLLAASCSPERPASRGPREVELPRPERPAACVEIPAGADLQAAVDAAAPGQALCLAPGTYDGPLQIEEAITLWGPGAVIRSQGKGSTVRLDAPGRLLGLTVDGSGGRFDKLDAAVRVQAEDALVEGLTIRNATFGILVERSKRVTIRGNHVVGDRRKALGLRGDGIRLWEAHGCLIEGNLVEASRDMVIWYSTDTTLLENTVVDGRYGSHLMYSHRSHVLRNRYVGNTVGVFVMYSREVDLRENLLADSAGAAGIGLGVKESGNLDVVRNLFVHNTIGAYLETSPLQQDDHNLFEENVFRLGETGVVFHSSQHRNVFRRNSFRDNFAVVRVEGGGDALGVTWDGNDYDDYAGYDLDGDGIGDIPYEQRRLSSDLLARTPSLEFFRGSLTLALVDAASHALPLVKPTLVLRDESPRMAPLPIEVVRGN
ncbi:MAG TPA: nitrous oxide reductase family maturation protein NosD [Vulgatibacter sp.]|nr:nitrous oxide reductase family maturation protein NosD [Vulgatibacter sp.]